MISAGEKLRARDAMDQRLLLVKIYLTVRTLVLLVGCRRLEIHPNGGYSVLEQAVKIGVPEQ